MFSRTYRQLSTIPTRLSMLKSVQKILAPNTIAIRKYSESIDLANVDYNYVKAASNSGQAVIVDVREPEEVKELGKIPNSINIPLGQVTEVLSQVSDKDFTNLYGKPKPKEDTEIIFYCMIGKRSGNAQLNAINLGYKNAKNYLGSWNDWAANSK